MPSSTWPAPCSDLFHPQPLLALLVHFQHEARSCPRRATPSQHSHEAICPRRLTRLHEYHHLIRTVSPPLRIPTLTRPWPALCRCSTTPIIASSRRHPPTTPTAPEAGLHRLETECLRLLSRVLAEAIVPPIAQACGRCKRICRRDVSATEYARPSPRACDLQRKIGLGAGHELAKSDTDPSEAATMFPSRNIRHALTLSAP